MPRAGREIEEIVAALEYLLSSDQARIVSPAFLPDKDSGGPREVDVAVYLTSGTHTFLVIIECRDRATPQDVQWIEQLATKRRSVGADKAIAVSTSGFSAGAVAKARGEQVELRSLREMTSDEAPNFLAPFPLMIKEYKVDVIKASVAFADATDRRFFDDATIAAKMQIAERGRNQLTRREKSFMWGPTRERFSFDELLQFPPIWRRITSVSSDTGVVEAQITFGNPDQVVLLDANEETIRVVHVDLILRVKLDQRLATPSKMHVYSGPSDDEIGRKLQYAIGDGTIDIFVKPVSGVSYQSEL